jgi:heterodisulfide reductase subunit A
MRIGVFICHCGLNIASTVDVEKVTREIAKLPHIKVCVNYKYMCSDPGQTMIIDAIKKEKLDRIVVGACSPTLHERTFRKCVESAGLNPYLVEMANIREQCSWVHSDKEEASKKAYDIIKLAIAKVSKNKPLYPTRVAIEKKALIIGGGVAGIQSAIDISTCGYKVAIVEKESNLGGRAIELFRTFPNLSTLEYIYSKIESLSKNPNVRIYTNSNVINVSGYVGNFKVNIKKENEIIEDKFGAIIVATGLGTLDPSLYTNYGYGKYKDVVTSLEFEKMLTNSPITRPSDGRKVESIVFIQCIGLSSLEREGVVDYCSKICCMYTAKHALLFKKQNPSGNAYIFYTDIVASGKDYEEFIEKVQDEYEVLYLRGQVSEILPNNGKLVVHGIDFLSGVDVEIDADLVVLVPPLIAHDDSIKLAQILGIPYDKNKFFTELHPKLAPIETSSSGIFLAGTCQGPKDISESIVSGSAAASKVLGLFSPEYILLEPIVARVNQRICNGCFDCKLVCPFRAIEEEITKEKRKVAKVIESMCHGCGNCTSSCRVGAIDLSHFTNEQIIAQINALI